MNRLKFKSRLKDFDLGLFVVNNKWDGEFFMLRSKLIVQMPDGAIEEIPAGYKTNLGSIPRLIRPFINKSGKSIRAYVWHDWAYSKDKLKQYSRKEIDDILYHLGSEDGEGYWTAQAIRKGLWIGGSFAFNKENAVVVENSRRTISYIAESNGYKLIKKEELYNETEDIKLNRAELFND